MEWLICVVSRNTGQGVTL